MYVCPLCKSGTKKNGTGALQISEDGTRITCHAAANCFGEKGEDTLGALRLLWHTDENGVFEALRLKVDDTPTRTTAAEDFKGMEYRKQDETERNAHTDTHTATYTAEPEADYTQLFADAHAHIAETDYPQRRGLSAAICDRFNLGYITNWKHPKAPEKVQPSPRLIIPTGKGSYLARDTRSNLAKGQADYAKSKVGKMHFLNASAALEAQQPVYIVEGEIDALSIIEAGGEALGLGSANRINALLEYLDAAKRKPVQPFIIALDNDEPGRKAAEKLSTGLKARGIAFYQYNPAGEHKDANEALVADRNAFVEAVARGAAIALEEANSALQEEREAYSHTTAADRLQDFINGIAASVDTPCIPTGFAKLDAALDGGFYPSLSLVGGLSSLGKTSLVLQIADQVAASGTDVLYFSLEMAEAELMSKSVSRHTLLEAQARKLDTKNAKSARGITDGKRYINYTKAERELIQAAIAAYGEYAGHIRIIRSGLGRTGVAEIREAVDKHIRLTGRKPLVVIDYLQIIRPESDRLTDKQAADAAVTGLKNLSADYNVAIVAISSLNRASYKDAISMEALKESGGLEYGSDIVIGLQLQGAGKSGFNATEEKKKDPRQIEAVILKNRNGRVGDAISFNYYPVFNYFAEDK